jgi:hypothetical protein
VSHKQRIFPPRNRCAYLFTSVYRGVIAMVPFAVAVTN